MSGHATPRPGAAAGRARWGFCGNCELWRLSGDWGDPPACPACGTPPAPLERWADGAYRLDLALGLPPGADLPLLGGAVTSGERLPLAAPWHRSR